MTNIIVIRAFVNRTVFGRVPRTKRGRPRRRCDRAVINSRDASQGVLVLVSSWTRRTVAPTQRWGLVSSSCAPSPSAASRPQNACLARTGALDSGRSGATKTQRHPPPRTVAGGRGGKKLSIGGGRPLRLSRDESRCIRICFTLTGHTANLKSVCPH